MEEPDFEHRIEEIDADLTAANTIAVNATWPATALACALIDKGLIAKRDLLEIVDTLILTASSYAVTAEADPEAATLVLEKFRLDLEELDLKPGHVLEELRKIEAGSALEAANYQAVLRRDEQKRKGSD